MIRGVQLYAHFDLPYGLTVSALNTERLLRERGAVIGRHSIAVRESRVEGPAESDVNLFHINPDGIIRFMVWPHADPRFEDRINACVPFWELARVPDFWVPVLSAMDVVLAPTSFVADAVRASIPQARIIPLPQAVEVPEGVGSARGRFGLPDGAVVFGTSFAAEAVLDRKNPEATIAAFLQAFPSEQDVRLVVRASPTGETEPEKVWAALEQAAHGDPRVVVPRERLDYAGVLSLYASQDVYVSLHRAEGLGLGMMESMSLGRPVIATGWSGNMDFMTPDNSRAVAYRLVPVRVDDRSPYSARSIGFEGEWAEPDVADAAAKMRLLYADPTLRATLGERARSDMAARARSVESAEFVDEIESLYQSGLVDGADHTAKAGALRALERHEGRRGLYLRPYGRVRREAGRALRRLGLR